jgi:hypothetical protein
MIAAVMTGSSRKNGENVIVIVRRVMLTVDGRSGGKSNSGSSSPF